MSRQTSLPISSRSVVAARVFGAAALGVASASVLNGCSSREPVAPQIKISSPAAPKNATTSEDKLAFGGWGELVRRWQDYPRTAPAPSRRTMNTGLPVNVALIAARHPAWRLAQALEDTTADATGARNALASSTGLAGVNAPNLHFSPFGFGGNWNQSALIGRQSPLAPAFAWPASTIGNGGTPVEGFGGLVLASGLPALQAQMAQRQRNTLNAFLSNTAATQQAAREDDLQARLAAMQEDIDRAREVNLSEIVPLLPEESIQLEMTNLRLHLQVLEAPGNVYARPEEIAKSRARLADLEAAWNSDLRTQEETRRNLLARLRDERPRQIEAQRRSEISLAQQSDERRDEDLRSEAGAAARQRIAEDFEAADARLGIVIPAAPANNRVTKSSNVSFRTRNAQSASQWPQSSTEATTTSINAMQAPLSLSDVGANGAGSDAAISLSEPGRVALDERQEQIRRLRALAWSDARQWARVVARRDAAFQRSVWQRAAAQKTATTAQKRAAMPIR